MNEFEDKRIDQAWGYFRQFVRNAGPCTVKLLFFKDGGVVSLHHHKNRDELYLIIDLGFTIWSDGRKYEPIRGDVIKVKAGCLHRVEFNSDREYGRFLNISLGDNDEEDIIWFDEDPAANCDHGKGSGCDF